MLPIVFPTCVLNPTHRWFGSIGCLLERLIHVGGRGERLGFEVLVEGGQRLGHLIRVDVFMWLGTMVTTRLVPCRGCCCCCGSCIGCGCVGCCCGGGCCCICGGCGSGCRCGCSCCGGGSCCGVGSCGCSSSSCCVFRELMVVGNYWRVLGCNLPVWNQGVVLSFSVRCVVPEEYEGQEAIF